MNTYSKPIDFRSDVALDSIDLMGKVATAKQQEYSKNREEYEAMLSKYNVDLLRDKDKAELGENLTALTNLINESGGLKFSDRGLKSKLEQHFNQALSPNIIKQVDNTRRVYKGMSEVENEKTKGTFSEANYYDMIKSSGYESYINGESDDLGDFKYKKYYDYNKDITTKLDKWAKGAGLTSYVDSQTNGVYFIDEYGKRVDSDKVKQFVQNEINNDPRIQDQLRMNSQYKYRNVSNEDFIKSYKNKIDFEVDSYESEKTKFMIKNKNLLPESEEYKNNENVINSIGSRIKQLRDLKIGEVNRQAVEYNLGVEDLKNNYSSLYSKQEVTKINRDDIESRIQSRMITDQLNLLKTSVLKAEKEAAEKPDFLVKREDIDVTKLDDRSDWDIATTDLGEKSDKLKGVLRGYEEFRDMSDQALNDAIISMYENNNTQYFGSQGIPYEVSDLVNQVGFKTQKLKDIKSEVFNDMTSGFINQYEKLLSDRSKFNVDNLSMSMPVSSKYIKEGTKFKDISDPKDRQRVLYEFGVSYSLDGGKVNKIGGAERPVDLFLEEMLKRNGKETFKEQRNTEQGGTIIGNMASSAWEAIKGAGSFGYSSINALRKLGVGKRGEALEIFFEGVKDSNKNLNKAGDYWKTSVDIDNRFWSRDSRIIDIDSDQANIGPEGKYVSLKKDYENLSNSITEKMKTKVGNLNSNIKEQYTALINPKLGKNEKQLFNTIGAFAPEGIGLNENQTLRVRDLNDGYLEVTAIADAKRIVGVGLDINPNAPLSLPFKIRKADLPDNIRNKFTEARELDYYSSKDSSSLVNSKVYGYKIPNGMRDKAMYLQNLSNKGGDILSQDNLSSWMDDNGSNKFKTKEFYKTLNSNLSSEDIDNLLDSTFKVIPYQYGKSLRYSVLVGDLESGREGMEIDSGTINEFEFFTDENFEAVIPSYIDRAIQKRIIYGR